MPRVKTTITISKELLDWVESKIDERVYSSLSHAVEYALYQQMKKESHRSSSLNE